MFLHIRALQSAGVDPGNLRLGEVLTFDVESGRDGRTKASSVRRQGKRIVAYHREFGMPKDPFIREKFTKLRQDARKLAADYFSATRKIETGRKLRAGAICSRIISSSRSSGYANRSTPTIDPLFENLTE
jgi:hypothetical protein